MLIDGVDPLVEMCLNCKEPECDGICVAAMETAGKAHRSVDSITLTYMGKTLTIKQWADMLGLERSTLYRRVERGLSIDDIFKRQPSEKASDIQINRTYYALSNMPLNYTWYTNHPIFLGSSQGYVAMYGHLKTAPTNRINDPTMREALKELNLTDGELEAILWIRCVQSVIERYLNEHHSRYKQPILRMRAEILRRRAFDGWTIKRLVDYFCNDGTPTSAIAIKNQYKVAVTDVANLAVTNGLVSDQK